MAIFAQDQAIVEIDDAADSLTDYSSGIKSCDLTGNINGSIFHVLGTTDAKALNGGRDYTFNITYYNDNTASSFAGVMRAWLTGATTRTSRNVEISMPDDQTGSAKLAFSVIPVGNFDLAKILAGDGNPSELTIALRVDGAVTPTVIA